MKILAEINSLIRNIPKINVPSDLRIIQKCMQNVNDKMKFIIIF